MQQTPILLQLLQLMDNLYIVATLVLVTIGIRVLWARHLKASEAPAPAQGHRTRQKNSATPVETKAPVKKKNLTLEIIDTVLIALILVFGIVRPLFLQTFFIPSESMVPTLLISDKLIANKFVYRFREPARGEVVVFQPPMEAIIGSGAIPNLDLRVLLETKTEAELRQINPLLADERDNQLAKLPPYPSRRDDYIKRTIGEPGDRIRIVADEGVYVNGELLPERYLPAGQTHSSINFPEEPANPSGAEIVANNGRLHDWYLHTVYMKRIAPHVKNGEFIVPRDSVFVMGDNRDNSFDSRYWGPVPLKSVKARAVSTFWPLKRLRLL